MAAIPTWWPKPTGPCVGYAYAGPYRARPAYRWSVEDSVYIAPEAHRRGIGRALLERLIEDAEQRGFRQMIAVIGDSAANSLDRAASCAGLSPGRHARRGRLQARPLARQRADAAPARPRRYDAGAVRRTPINSPPTLSDAIEHAQHAIELVAALEDESGYRHDAVGALTARQLRVSSRCGRSAFPRSAGTPRTPPCP